MEVFALTIAEVRAAWQQETPDHVIGFAQTPGWCPLAAYLNGRTPGTTHFVRAEGIYACPPGHVTVEDDTPNSAAPAWVMPFMALIDSEAERYCAPVTAQRALAVLERIERDYPDTV